MADKLVSDFVQGIKRISNIGDINLTTDVVTIDIIRRMNYQMDEIINAGTWDWIIKPFTLTTVVGQMDYILDASVIALVGFTNDALKKKSVDDMIVTYNGRSNLPDPNYMSQMIAWYIPIGHDSVTGAKKIRLSDVPGVIYTYEYWGKVKFDKFLLADADLASTKTFAPMPDNIVGALESLVIGDIYESQNKMNEAVVKRREAMNILKRYLQETLSDPAERSVVQVCSYLKSKYQSRMGNHVV